MSTQLDCLDSLKTLIDNIQDFSYVDFYVQKNISKIGRRFPAVLIEDGEEEWEGAGGGAYDVQHYVDIHFYMETNQDRIETALDYQDQIINAINANTSLSGHAVCVNVEGVDKGGIYEGAVDWSAAGMNDNITERIIRLRIWEKING